MLICDSLPRVGYDWLFALMGYGPRWRRHRRAVHPTMTPDVVPQYQAFHLDAARNLLRLVLQNPDDLASHIKLCAFSLCSPISKR